MSYNRQPYTGSPWQQGGFSSGYRNYGGMGGFMDQMSAMGMMSGGGYRQDRYGGYGSSRDGYDRNRYDNRRQGRGMRRNNRGSSQRGGGRGRVSSPPRKRPHLDSNRDGHYSRQKRFTPSSSHSRDRRHDSTNKKTNRKRKFPTCRLCRLGFFQYDNLKDHLEGEEHKKKEKEDKEGKKKDELVLSESEDEVMFDEVPIFEKETVEDSELVAVGQMCVVPINVYYCKLCQKIFHDQDSARGTHCKSDLHLEKHKAYLEEKEKRALERKQKKEKGGDDAEGGEDEVMVVEDEEEAGDEETVDEEDGDVEEVDENAEEDDADVKDDEREGEAINGDDATEEPDAAPAEETELVKKSPPKAQPRTVATRTAAAAKAPAKVPAKVAAGAGKVAPAKVVAKPAAAPAAKTAAPAKAAAPAKTAAVAKEETEDAAAETEPVSVPTVTTTTPRGKGRGNVARRGAVRGKRGT